MATIFSYDPLLSTPRDQVRFLLGDTEESTAVLNDPEIDFCLEATAVSDPETATEDELQQALYEAAIMACQGILARVARGMEIRVGDLSLNPGQAFEHYESLLRRLQSKLAGGGGTVPLIRV